MILPDLIHFAWLALAVLLEIAANILLKYSNGFKKILPGMLSLACVLLAFSALSQAVIGIDLSVAYALWGGLVSSRPWQQDGYCLVSGSTPRAGRGWCCYCWAWSF